MGNAALDLLTKCSILHIEPSVRMTERLDGMLREHGIQNLQHLVSSAQVETHPPTLQTDIVLVDFDHDVSAGMDFVRGLRRGRLKADPFLLIIGTQSDTDSKLVEREANAGVDIILKKPFSASDFFNRVAPFAVNPRQFALSQNYVGPDRRGKARLGSEGDVHVVPNRLKLRAEDRFTGQDAEQWLNSWRIMVADLEAGRPIIDCLPIGYFDIPMEELPIPKI